jgi:predicted transcriptional regulator
MDRRIRLTRWNVIMGVALACFALGAHAVTMNVPSGYIAKNIGTSALADPSGTTHTKQEVAGKVVVAIFSAPTMSQGDSQQKWSDLLDTQLPRPTVLVLVEDMTQAGFFKGIALSDMKKQFTPHSRPFLMLDEDGAVTKRFGVPRNHTVVLVYDKKSKLRDVEPTLDPNTTVSRLQAITKQLQAE